MLARGSTYFQNAKTKLCRISFKNYNLLKIIPVFIQLFYNFQKIKKNSNNHLTLECFPNCPILNNQIDYERMLPEIQIEEFQENCKIQFKIEKSSQLNLHDSEKIIVQTSQCVGQLFVFYIQKPLVYLHSGTAFFCNMNQQDILITALHCINAFPITLYNKLLYFSLSEEDLLNKVQGILESFEISIKKCGPENMNKEIEILTNQLQQFGCQQVFIDDEFLEHRKQWILRQKRNFIYLDPISRLKPCPACDIALLTFNIKKHLSLIPLKSPISKQQIHKNIYIIAYNDNNKFLNLSKKYFDALPQPRSCLLSLQIFLNEGKSVSGGILIKFNAGLLCFQSSASAGSSGGPILNKDGNVIGINTGNFYGEEKSENLLIVENDPATFDIKLEEQKGFCKIYKNYSLGVNIQHPMLLEYLENQESKIRSTTPNRKKRITKLFQQQKSAFTVSNKKIHKRKESKKTKIEFKHQKFQFCLK